MKILLKIANHITAYVSLAALISFLTILIQVTLKMKYNIFFSELTGLLLVISFYFAVPIEVILFFIRRFVFKEIISSFFSITLFAETLLIYLLCFNVGNIMYYVFD